MAVDRQTRAVHCEVRGRIVEVNRGGRGSGPAVAERRFYRSANPFRHPLHRVVRAAALPLPRLAV